MRILLCGLVGVVVGCGFKGEGTSVSIDARIDPDVTDGDHGEDIDDGPAVAKQRTLTIAAGTVAADVAEFPVWIDIDLPGATPSNAELYFSNAAGTAYEWELQHWDPQTKRVQAWVRTDVRAGAATIIVAHYGPRASAPPTVSTAKNVFDLGNKFAAVWHLESNANPVVDATDTHPGTAVGFTGASIAAGKLGQGVVFDGTDDVITFTNTILGNVPSTMSAWVESRNAADENDMVIKLGDGATPPPASVRWMNVYWDTPNSFAGGTTGPGNDMMTMPQKDVRNDGQKHLLTWVCKGGDKKQILYLDGAEVFELTANDAPDTMGDDGFIGAGGGFGGGQAWMKGLIDEVRISTEARKPEWIEAEFKNQNDPSMFYTAGDEVDDPTP